MLEALNLLAMVLGGSGGNKPSALPEGAEQKAFLDAWRRTLSGLSKKSQATLSDPLPILLPPDASAAPIPADSLQIFAFLTGRKLPALPIPPSDLMLQIPGAAGLRPLSVSGHSPYEPNDSLAATLQALFTQPDDSVSKIADGKEAFDALPLATRSFFEAHGITGREPAEDGAALFKRAVADAEAHGSPFQAPLPQQLDPLLEIYPPDTDNSAQLRTALPLSLVQSVPDSAANAPELPPPLERPIGHPSWDQELGERILWLAGRSLSSAELRINPPALGPLEVRVQMHQDQATIAFSSQHAAVREAIEAAIPRLREIFGSHQIQLVDVNVSQQSFAGHRDDFRDGTTPHASIHFPAGLAADPSSGIVDLRPIALVDRLLNLYV